MEIHICDMDFAGWSTVQPLTWDIRLKIAIGAAQGLSFLHNLDKSVIYRDFKTSNILLDRVSLVSFVGCSSFIHNCTFLHPVEGTTLCARSNTDSFFSICYWY